MSRMGSESQRVRGKARMIKVACVILLLTGLYFSVNFLYGYFFDGVLDFRELMRGLCLSFLALIGYVRPSILVGKSKIDK